MQNESVILLLCVFASLDVSSTAARRLAIGRNTSVRKKLAELARKANAERSCSNKSNNVALSSSMKTFVESFFVLILGAASTLEGKFQPKTPLCANPLMNNNYRQVFLTFHNRKRLDVALGREPNSVGMLSLARGMYLLSWNCDLEYKAQAAVACPGFPPNFANTAANMKRSPYPDASTSVTDIFYKILEEWWGIGRTVGIDSNNAYHRSIASFGKMVFSRATKLGCAYQICSSGDERYINVACLYNAVPRENEPLWITGPPCTNDLECTHPNSLCAGGMCVEGATKVVYNVYNL
ncbi:unnamed protein product [Cylicocyclus nassatus]|uniref:SCP domain-containing protein n=1 Tax=Cylicocyclus nassatus TaxID=53992 RepID=A0AA36H7E6_CYLNA|nr:unnamed protein product [Cylicocyclus nassatus]